MALLAGCRDNAAENHRMDRAEALMESTPDSAMLILDSVSSASLTTKKDKARYALLKSVALDKNYIDTTTFDVLQPAIDYYLKKGTPDEKLRTLYYQGRIYQNNQKMEKAMESFIVATELKEQISDSLTLGRLYSIMSSLYANQYRIEDYIESARRATEIFTLLSRPEFRYISLNDQLNGYILLENQHKADSLINIISKTEERVVDPNEYYRHNVLSYGAGFLSENRLRSLIDSISNLTISDEDILLDLARAYARVGDLEKSSLYIDSITDDKILGSAKYMAIKSDVLESKQEYKGAVTALREYIARSESRLNTMNEQEVMFVENKYKLERGLILERQHKEYIISISVIAGLGLIIFIILLYLRLRLTELKKLKLEKEELKLIIELQTTTEEKSRMMLEKEEALQQNERLSNEVDSLNSQKNIIAKEKNDLKDRVSELTEENETMRTERDHLQDDVSRIKENIESLLTEREGLYEIINSQTKISSEFMELVKERLSILNSFVASHITTSEKHLRHSNSLLERATKDKKDFLDSTKQIFRTLHGDFMKTLVEKGLTELEMDYVCLYALGLKGKEIGEYLQTKRHYNISSEIRVKLGLEGADTNLGLYIRAMLK